MKFNQDLDEVEVTSCTKEVKGNKIQLEMIREFQCPGCSCGTYPDEGCEAYKLEEENDIGSKNFFRCGGWHPGTFIGGIGRICLGLPKGFTRVGAVDLEIMKHYFRMYEKPEDMPEYNRFNVPVWAMERDGYLFVRCVCPRSNWFYVDVIKGGKVEMASFTDGEFKHQAIDVGKFIDEID